MLLRPWALDTDTPSQTEGRKGEKMELKNATTLYVAVSANGTIVNDNDIRALGPVFQYTDTKINGDRHYALHIDANGLKQGAFDIKDCQLVSASTFAKLYCEKHGIAVASHSWVERTYWRNTYEVVDTNGVEYHFTLSRAYEPDGRCACWDCVYISTKKDGEISIGDEITNIHEA
jgi:hypothetical protein